MPNRILKSRLSPTGRLLSDQAAEYQTLVPRTAEVARLRAVLTQGAAGIDYAALENRFLAAYTQNLKRPTLRD